MIVVLVVTVLFVLFLRTNPTGREFFDRARTLIVVNLLITFRIFVRCQRLIARNVANGFLLNRGVSHHYEACRIDDVSRGSLSGYENR